MKPQVYVDPRPAEFFDGYHERVRSGRPDGMYRIVRIVLTGPCWLLYRAMALGTERVPERGPLILAPNHFSNLDHFFLAMFLRREVQFMAKSQLFKFPIDFIMNHGGTFPVRRGQHDVEAFKTAYAVLDRGGMVAMYAEGGRSRTKRLGKPKSGLGRLALESGAPVVPVAIHGSEHAREVRKLRFPKVTIMFGEPIVFEAVESPDREQCQWASIEVFERVRKLHEVLSTDGRRGARRDLKDPAPSRRPEPELLVPPESFSPERVEVLS
jgi:1-acyl-sn-glycerol-3-phosphate acyltransferase